MWHVSKMYNITLYDIQENDEIRQKLKNLNLNIASSSVYSDYRKNNWHSEYLHSHTLQQTIIHALHDYKTYIALDEMYTKEPNKLKGKPHMPRYTKAVKEVVVFTKYAIRRDKNIIKLSLSKKMQEKHKVKSLNFEIPKKVQKLICMESIKQIVIKKKNGNYEISIIYERQEKEKQIGSNIMAIDLGISNIVACTNLENIKTMLISGDSAKSKNKYYNEKISKLQQKEMLKLKDSKKYKSTKQIQTLYKKRNRYMETLMHKVSKEVIRYAKENNCSKIVIGDLKNIKQGNKIKNFVQIPLQKLVSKIQYKAKLEGIEVVLINEAYTSGVSTLDKEEINKENYKKERRIKRGIFKTNENKLINADINGSLNILRKYLKNSIPNLEIAMDNGREQRPFKKNVA